MRKDSGHVVRCLDQSASFRIFDSTFYLPHSAFRNSAFYQHPRAQCRATSLIKTNALPLHHAATSLVKVLYSC